MKNTGWSSRANDVHVTALLDFFSPANIYTMYNNPDLQHNLFKDPNYAVLIMYD